MIVIIVFLIIQCLLIGCIQLKSLAAYRGWMKQHRFSLREAWLAPAGLWLTDRLRLLDRFPDLSGKVLVHMSSLYGQAQSGARAKWFYSCALSWMMLVMGLTTLLAWSGESAELPVYGALLSILVPFGMYKRLTSQVTRKKRRMLLELPEVLDRLMLLIGAGDTVPQAFKRMVEARANGEQESHPLWEQLAYVVRALEVNAPFAKTMEEFSKRCAFQEAALLSTTLLLNYKRGGNELVMSLKELSLTLWERRKALVKTLGEEASSKLVFPMVLIFFTVMVVIAAPAILMMNS